MCSYKYRAMALKYLIHLLTKFSFTENVSWVYINMMYQYSVLLYVHMYAWFILLT